MNIKDLLKKQYIIPISLGVIIIFLMYIIILMVLPGRGQRRTADNNNDLEQVTTDHADTQTQQDNVSELTNEAVPTESAEDQKDETTVSEETRNEIQGSKLVASDRGKDVIIVGEEDEDDVYSKEYILNEIFPYFEANNHAAIWDLAHLKRYIKLSLELKDTNGFYYKGTVNGNGKPDGKGLAVYEDNSYYYGGWSDGVRSGDGRWFRFYIDEKSKRNAMGIYTSHSYAGEWADDLPNGSGAEHFDVDISQIEGSKRVIQNVVGNFTDGLYDGEMFANTVNHMGNVEEWFGTASKGVFTLWRDMSSSGMCSIWHSKDDQDVYLDIDKSENKNQGIQELLRQNIE